VDNGRQCLVGTPVAHIVAAINASQKIERTIGNGDVSLMVDELIEVDHVRHDETGFVVAAEQGREPVCGHE